MNSFRKLINRILGRAMCPHCDVVLRENAYALEHLAKITRKVRDKNELPPPIYALPLQLLYRPGFRLAAM